MSRSCHTSWLSGAMQRSLKRSVGLGSSGEMVVGGVCNAGQFAGEFVMGEKDRMQEERGGSEHDPQVGPADVVRGVSR